MSVLKEKGSPQVPRRVPLELQRENVSVSQGKKVVLKCQEEYLWNYREGECVSVLGKIGCP